MDSRSFMRAPWLVRAALASWPFLAFAIVFILASVYAYSRTSATWDEPIHLVDGYAALTSRDYRIDPSHPPFARMYGALPIRQSGMVMDLSRVDVASPERWATGTLFEFVHHVVYEQNDADRLLYRARFAIVLLGVLLGGVMFVWAGRWLGAGAAALAALFVGLEPNLLAHFSLVTTDGALTCFAFATVFFLWQWMRSRTFVTLLLCAGSFALACISKFTAVLLIPIVVPIVATEVWRRRLRVRDAVLCLVVIGALTWTAIWAVYGFRYAPSADPNWLYTFHEKPYVVERVPAIAAVVKQIDRFHLLPNVYSEGFLLAQAQAQKRWAYLAGDVSETGWWYFFPIALLVKTPVPLLVLATAGLVVMWRRDDRVEGFLYIVWPPLVFLGTAMLTKINIGLRHVLPVFPFMILSGVVAAHYALSTWGRRGRYVVLASAVVWLFEAGVAYPHPLAFFNTLAGGPSGGSKYLVDSNLDWGQDLKGLKAWMDEHQVHHVNLAYFGSADPAYYGLDCTFMNGGVPIWGGVPAKAPQLPGFIAVSQTVLSGVYLEEHRDYYQALRKLTPIATIGHSINVYWVEEPW